MNIAWAAHGVRLEQFALILTNSIGLCSTLPILYLLARQFRRRLLTLILPSLVVAAAMITVDHVLGSAAYGIVAIAVALISNIGQSMQLVRAPHVTGVSPLFVTMAVVNQAVWVTWGLLVKDAGTVMTASTVCGLTSFNLIWYVLRRIGLRAFFPHETLATPPAQSRSSVVDRAQHVQHGLVRIHGGVHQPDPLQHTPGHGDRGLSRRP